MEQRYWVRLLPRGVCPQPEGGAPCLAVVFYLTEAMRLLLSQYSYLGTEEGGLANLNEL